VLANPRYPAADAPRDPVRTGADASDLPSLPATATEALAVVASWAAPAERHLLELPDPAAADAHIEGERFRVLLGAEAREAALTPAALRDVRVLHFACHGVLDTSTPPLSFLALSLADDVAGDADDGLLRLCELARLRGSYELLTLSACRTAAGRALGHQGAASLATAGDAIGAARTLATLWQVTDHGSAALVTAFYRHWLGRHSSSAGDPPGAADALARAQRAAIGDGLPVSDWAAFVLSGEAR
jgi:CHAT domain-containing protein